VGNRVGAYRDESRYSSQFTVGTPVDYPDWLAPDHLVIYYRFSVAF
jgi:hypothetical protein